MSEDEALIFKLYKQIIDEIIAGNWENARQCDWYDKRFEQVARSVLGVAGSGKGVFLIGYIQGRCEGMQIRLKQLTPPKGERE